MDRPRAVIAARLTASLASVTATDGIDNVAPSKSVSIQSTSDSGLHAKNLCTSTVAHIMSVGEMFGFCENSGRTVQSISELVQ